MTHEYWLCILLDSTISVTASDKANLFSRVTRTCSPGWHGIVLLGDTDLFSWVTRACCPGGVFPACREQDFHCLAEIWQPLLLYNHKERFSVSTLFAQRSPFIRSPFFIRHSSSPLIKSTPVLLLRVLQSSYYEYSSPLSMSTPVLLVWVQVKLRLSSKTN